MNTLQLTEKMRQLDSGSKYGDIINIIIYYYNNTLGFYEEDALRVFSAFLVSGVLYFGRA